MATFLHDIDTLVHLAAEEGLVGEWARELLVFRDRDAALSVPPCLYAGVLGADGLTRLRDAPLPDAAVGWVAGAFLGALDPDDDVLVAGVRAALERADATYRPGLAWILAMCDALDLETATTVARDAPETEAAFCVAALIAATPEDERQRTAARLAEALSSTIVHTAAILLGAPRLFGITALPRHPHRAAAMGIRIACGEAADVPPAKGSARHRARTIARGLLAGRTDPLSCLLDAAFAAGKLRDRESFGVVASAWVSRFTPEDPLSDAVVRRAGGHVGRLGRARRAQTSADRDLVARALAHGDAAIAGLALDHLDAHPALPDVVLRLWETHDGLIDDLPGLTLVGAAAAARHPARVVSLLADPDTRDLGLTLARFVVTEEILATLLDLPVPADPDVRHAYASTLARTGDRAALPLLRGLRDAYPGELADAMTLAAALHRDF